MVTSDERDRYGEKLRHLGKAREHQWAAQREQELLENLRKEALEGRKSDPARQLATKVFSGILWPTDFDERSLEALELAQKLCVQNGATLYLLHVSPIVSVPPGGAKTKTVGDEELARQKLRSIAANRLAAIQHEIIVTSGNPATKIVEIAESLKAELIVIATHGRQGLQRFFLGSVAERIMREAPCPILTMRCH